VRGTWRLGLCCGGRWVVAEGAVAGCGDGSTRVVRCVGLLRGSSKTGFVCASLGRVRLRDEVNAGRRLREVGCVVRCRGAGGVVRWSEACF